MKENSGQDRKQKIRDKYKGTDVSEIEIIPAKPIVDFAESGAASSFDGLASSL